MNKNGKFSSFLLMLIKSHRINLSQIKCLLSKHFTMITTMIKLAKHSPKQGAIDANAIQTR
jgi:hypothetical protein